MWRAVLKVQEQKPEAQAEVFQDLLCCPGVFRETLSLVKPRGGGAGGIWKCLQRFQGTRKHDVPSLGGQRAL